MHNETLLSLSFPLFRCSGFAVGIYTTNSPEACQYVADNCKANIIVVENHKQLQKILQVRSESMIVQNDRDQIFENKCRQAQFYDHIKRRMLGRNIKLVHFCRISIRPHYCEVFIGQHFLFKGRNFLKIPPNFSIILVIESGFLVFAFELLPSGICP